MHHIERLLIWITLIVIIYFLIFKKNVRSNFHQGKMSILDLAEFQGISQALVNIYNELIPGKLTPAVVKALNGNYSKLSKSDKDNWHKMASDKVNSLIGDLTNPLTTPPPMKSPMPMPMPPMQSPMPMPPMPMPANNATTVMSPSIYEQMLSPSPVNA